MESAVWRFYSYVMLFFSVSLFWLNLFELWMAVSKVKQVDLINSVSKELLFSLKYSYEHHTTITALRQRFLSYLM